MLLTKWFKKIINKLRNVFRNINPFQKYEYDRLFIFLNIIRDSSDKIIHKLLLLDDSVLLKALVFL